MPDYGARYADRAISSVEKDLKKTYRTAQKELKEKLADFNAKFRAKDREKRNLLKEGKISLQDYRDWQTGQVFVREQWRSRIKQVNSVLLDFNREAMKLVNEKKLDVFAENYNYQAYLTEGKILGVSFDVYNSQAVANLILENPDLLPEWNIDEEKDYEWNYEKVNNAVKQGIIQGESIDQITDRLCNDLAAKNENKMRTFARTAMTGAQNAGRQQQMADAAEMGIEVRKKWLATLDNRTRDAHRHLDGEEIPYDESFDSDLGAIAFPGDPSATAANIYNCRCTLITVYPKYQDKSSPDVRRAYNEYTDSEGKQVRRSYLTTDQAAYQAWKHGKEKKQEEEQRQTLGADGQRPIEKYLQPKYNSEEERSMVLRGLKKIVGDHTIAMDAEAVNPEYNLADPTTSQNCQRCVNAYVARRRGYDVVTQRIYIPDDHYAIGDNFKECYNTTNKAMPFWKDITETLSHSDVRRRFESYMKEKADGTIVLLTGYWDIGDTGHVFVAEKEKGKIVFIDPQTGNTYADYIDLMQPKSMRYFDVTGIPFNEKIFDMVVGRK